MRTMKGLRKGKEQWLTPVPRNVATQKVAFKFKLDPSDAGKAEAIQVDEEMIVTHISFMSLYNGLIGGDKLVKVNDATGKKCVSEILKGDTCSVEVIRRKGQLALKQKPKCLLRKGHAIFLLEVERPPNMTITSVGVKLTMAKKRAIVNKIETNTIGYPFFGRGDMIIEMDGTPVPENGAPDSENIIREQLSKLSTGKKMTFLIERAIEKTQAKDWQKFIEQIGGVEVDNDIAMDVIEIGREAANMHFMVFRKLQTPSILSSDVNKAKQRRSNNNKTSDANESTISISTASTEMKIKSDVAMDEDLKPVTKKSHAVTSDNDEGGAYEDE